MAERIEGEPNLSRRGFVILAGMTAGGAACGPITRLIEEAIQTPTSAEPTKTRTLTPIPTNTATPTPTETPIPTPDFEKIDSDNERLLREARGGEIRDLPYPRLTSIWKFPWFGEEDKPKDAIITFVWGKETSSGLVTSADCIFEHYRKTGNLGKQVWLFPEIWRPEGRINNLRVEVSNVPSPIKVVDAQEITIDPNKPSQVCKQVKELERLQKFLASIDWKDLTRLSARELGEFVVSFLRGLEEAGIDVPFFP